MEPLWQHRRPLFQSPPVRPEALLAPAPSPEKRMLGPRSQVDRKSACLMEVISLAEQLALSQELNLMKGDPLTMRGQAAGWMEHPVNREAR
jgi:hypothetical protein